MELPGIRKFDFWMKKGSSNITHTVWRETKTDQGLVKQRIRNQMKLLFRFELATEPLTGTKALENGTYHKGKFQLEGPYLLHPLPPMKMSFKNSIEYSSLPSNIQICLVTLVESLKLSLKVIECKYHWRASDNKIVTVEVVVTRQPITQPAKFINDLADNMIREIYRFYHRNM